MILSETAAPTAPSLSRIHDLSGPETRAVSALVTRN